MESLPPAPLQLQRILPASAAELFAAFVDVERLRQWFAPAPGMTANKVRGTAGPHPSSELTFALPAGPEVVLRFTFGERVAGQRLGFDIDRIDPRGSRRSHATVEFHSTGPTTTVTLRHEGLAGDERRDAEAAWKHSLGRLIGACPRALDAYSARLDRFPHYRSAFGGFWPDLVDAEARLAGKQALGAFDAADAARFAHWLQKGYVVLEGAVAPACIDAFRAEVARDWERGNPAVTIELCDGDGGFVPMQPALRDRPHKVLDYHGQSRLARDVQFAPAIQRFLGQLFERPPMAFQSLLFRYGTEQPMHQDTAYVVLRSPMEFVGCWIALEDVMPGSGELQYYEGSHRIPEFQWFGRSRARPPKYEDDREFLAWVREQSERAGCPLVRFLPKKGDALLWHADLVHGGSPRIDRQQTRWSLVSHFCPVDVEPEWMERERHLGPLEHAPGCWYSQLLL